MKLAPPRTLLAGDLARGGYLPDEQAGWFETSLTLTRPGVLRRCAAELGPLLPPDVDRLAARGGAGIALATAVALDTGIALALADGDAPVASAWRAGGELFPGARVALLEDVVLSGAHALASASGLREAGVEVVAVVCLLEREVGGRFVLESAGLPVRAAFCESDLRAPA